MDLRDNMKVQSRRWQYIFKLINNSKRQNKGSHYRDGGCRILLSIKFCELFLWISPRIMKGLSMSYRKHGSWVLIERCFKQTALKYVDYSIKLSPYRQFCCPLPLIYALSFANIPVSLRFFGEFEPDMLAFSARHFKKPLIPSSTQPTRKLPKAALNPNG